MDGEISERSRLNSKFEVGNIQSPLRKYTYQQPVKLIYRTFSRRKDSSFIPAKPVLSVHTNARRALHLR